ncbi:MAG: DUF2846 domain-containing protein [Luteolibacter sp.]
MKTTFLTGLPAAAAALMFVSCATGAKYAEVRGTLPPIPPKQGRVFVYRPNFLASEFQPSVKIDGNPSGVSQATGFFYSDQYPGSHQLSIFTPGWKDTITVNVEKGRASYVRCDILPGIAGPRIRPVQVDEATGENGMWNTRLTR